MASAKQKSIQEVPGGKKASKKGVKKDGDGNSGPRERQFYMEVTCTGITPMLQDPMPQKEVEETLIFGVRKAKDVSTPIPDRARAKLYRGPNGEYGFTGDMLFSALNNGGRYVKVGKSMLATKEETRVPCILQLTADFIPFLDQEAGWTPQVKRGRMKDGTACGIVRPKFDKWAFTALVLVDLDGFAGAEEKHVHDLFRMAGKAAGLGAWRPSCKGKYGQFRVTNVVKKSLAEVEGAQSAA